MKKTSVYLTDQLARRLKQLAAVEGRSEADVLRRALAAYVPEHEPGSFALARSGEGPGTSIADVPDEELLVGFGES